MSEFAGNLPRKFISFRHLGFGSSAHDFPEGRERIARMLKRYLERVLLQLVRRQIPRRKLCPCCKLYQ